MMNRYVTAIFIFTSVLFFTTGCTTKVSRIDTKEVTDLSGQWNDTDSRFVSEEMIKDALNRPWLSQFKSSQNRAPVLIVGGIRNLSHEHINVNTFVGDMERELINSGKVEFVASSTERSDIRDERKDMDLHASEETRKAMGRETGADFMLKGQINTIFDVKSDDQIKYYQIDLTLISLADNKKVWVGQKKIKKLVEKKKLRF